MVAILLLTVGLIWVVTPTLQQRIIEVGDTAPDFSIMTEQGKKISRSDFDGKLLRVEFLGELVSSVHR